MATVFEVLIAYDENESEYAAQAARAVFLEIDRLEQELSRFLPGSDIWRVNNQLKGGSCPVGLATMDCLGMAKAVNAATGGAFDVTIGPLMKIYRQADGANREPDPEELEYARKRVGIEVYDLNEDGFVSVNHDYPLIDLGAIGKGYALDQGAMVLQEWGVENALLNAGESSILAMGSAVDEEGWIVTVGNQERRALRLMDRAISGSGFNVQGNHIMNPRTMRPVPMKRELVWASAPTAALSDALSTAFMVMEPEEIDAFCKQHPEVASFLD